MTELPTFSIPEPPSEGLELIKKFLDSFRDEDGNWDHEKFIEMVGLVGAYSLIDYEMAGSTYTIHPLVHEWMRESVDPQDTLLLGAQCLCGLSIDSDEGWDGISFRGRLLPHVQACLSYGDLHVGPGIQKLISNVLHDAGSWSKAEHIRESIYRSRETVLGKDHPDVLCAMGCLAVTYRDQDKFQEAEALQVRVLERRKRVLGEDPSQCVQYHGQSCYHIWESGTVPRGRGIAS